MPCSPSADYSFQSTAVTVDWLSDDLLAVGQLDGAVRLIEVERKGNREDGSSATLARRWRGRLRSAVRRVRAADKHQRQLLVLGANRSLCVWDAAVGRRQRCVVAVSGAKAGALAALMDGDVYGATAATGDEDGTVALWDFRADRAKVCSFKEGRHTDEVCDVCVAANAPILLSAGGDGAVCAWDARARRLLVRSERMHDALNSLTVANNGRTYAAAGDGYVEVFNRGEWGNLVERIYCGPSGGIDCIRRLREDALVCSSYTESKLRFIQLSPSKRVGALRWDASVASLAGVAETAVSPAGRWLTAVCLDDTIKLWSVDTLLDTYFASKPQPMGGEGRRAKRRKKASKVGKGDDSEAKLAFFQALARAEPNKDGENVNGGGTSESDEDSDVAE